MDTWADRLPDERERSALLAALHSGPIETPMWRTFLDRLRDRLDVSTTNFSFRLDDASGVGIRTVAIDPATKNASSIDRGGMHVIYSPPAPHPMLPGRIYAVHDHLDPALPEHASFIRDVMLRHDFTHLYVARIEASSGAVALLGIASVGKALDDAQIRFIEDLAPHLEVSLNTAVAIDRERSRSFVSADAVRRLNFCWIRLDVTGRIIDFDPPALDVLRQSENVMIARDGMLVLGARKTNRSLLDALQVLVTRPDARARALHLSDQPWLDMLLVPSRDVSLVDAMERSVIAFIHGEAEVPENRRDQLSDLFGLTAKEASLALAISRGRTIRETALELGLTENSAREYSRRIYAKTGARNQADLVRLILTSVVALA